MGQGNARIFNFLSIFFLVLTVLFVLWVISRLVGPPPAQQVIVVPTIAVLPTDAPTNTTQPTFPPTFTLTPTDTLSPTPAPPTNTETPTPAPSTTITDTPGPTDTPTITPTPTVTETPVPPPTSDAPTITSPPPFLFAVDTNQVIFTTNYVTSGGCTWQGVTGNIFDENRAPLLGIIVHVFADAANPGIDTRVQSGSNNLLGASGWEVGVGNSPAPTTYYVELETQFGTPVSDRIRVTFPGTCDQNQAIINFIQVRPIGA